MKLNGAIAAQKPCIKEPTKSINAMQAAWLLASEIVHDDLSTSSVDLMGITKLAKYSVYKSFVWLLYATKNTDLKTSVANCVDAFACVDGLPLQQVLQE